VTHSGDSYLTGNVGSVKHKDTTINTKPKPGGHAAPTPEKLFAQELRAHIRQLEAQKAEAALPQTREHARARGQEHITAHKALREEVEASQLKAKAAEESRKAAEEKLEGAQEEIERLRKHVASVDGLLKEAARRAAPASAEIHRLREANEKVRLYMRPMSSAYNVLYLFVLTGAMHTPLEKMVRHVFWRGVCKHQSSMSLWILWGQSERNACSRGMMLCSWRPSSRNCRMQYKS
jgi:hypothetical protein